MARGAVPHWQRKRRRPFKQNIMLQSAVDAYLERDYLVNHDFIKDVSRDDLFNEVGRFRFYTTPRLHQLACFILGIDYPGFAFFVDMGGGKTKIVLDIIRYRRQRNGLKASLVVVPYPANVIGWKDECVIHAPNLRIVSLIGTKAEREEALKQEADVYLINYSGLFVMMCDLIREEDITAAQRKENRQRASTGLKPKWVSGRRFNEKKADAFSKHFGCVVFDESQYISDHRTTQFKLCSTLARAAEFCYILTGTPHGKDPAPLWSQMYCIDFGQTFGEKFTLFRSVFYNPVVNKFGTTYKFNRLMKDALRRLTRNRSIRYEDTEFSDLPPISYTTVPVTMDVSMLAYYTSEKKKFKDSWATGGLSVKQIKGSYHRLRAITSGYVTGRVDMEDEKDSFKVHMAFPYNPKIEALRSLIESLPSGRKLIVFHNYVFSGDLIVKLCRSLKLGYARIGGGADGPAALTKFKTDPDCRIFIAQAAAGGVGHNLQMTTNYLCFFELPNVVQRKQCVKRAHRYGQLHRVFVYDLIMKYTIDSEIADALSSDVDFLNQLLKGQTKKLFADQRQRSL